MQILTDTLTVNDDSVILAQAFEEGLWLTSRHFWICYSCDDCKITFVLPVAELLHLWS